jgi:hypothetical protein
MGNLQGHVSRLTQDARQMRETLNGIHNLVRRGPGLHS